MADIKDVILEALERLEQFFRVSRRRSLREEKRVAADGQAVKVAVLIGGIGMSSNEVFRLFRKVHLLLAERGFIVRYFDYSPSDTPANFYLASDTYLQDIKALERVLTDEIRQWALLTKIDLVIVGHSLGGLVATSAATNLAAFSDVANKPVVVALASPIHMPIHLLTEIPEGDEMAALLAGYNPTGATINTKFINIFVKNDEWIRAQFSSYKDNPPEKPHRERGFSLSDRYKRYPFTRYHDCICLYDRALRELTRVLDE